MGDERSTKRATQPRAEWHVAANAFRLAVRSIATIKQAMACYAGTATITKAATCFMAAAAPFATFAQMDNPTSISITRGEPG
jgi:hypothetical protein